MEGVFSSTFHYLARSVFMVLPFPSPATNSHGFHMIIGIIRRGIRQENIGVIHLTKEHYVGFEAAA